ncbi:MAG: glycosyltransferase [Bacteroidetes bacterium]|nr:glycosyltransferase [Bacteroidota bacterium]
MKISIITPAFNSVSYLKKCVKSIGDQTYNIDYEHIIIDGGSSDGTKEYLNTIQSPHIKFISEKDNGMYHALNKGLNMTSGEIIGHLNSDEQYLPGTFEKVVSIFEENPQIDIIFGHCVFINPDGTPVCFRKSYTPKWYLIRASYLYLMTCTIFFRRSIIDSGLRFDETLKSIADEEFVCSILMQNFRGKVVNHYFSAFTMTGSNLMLKPISFAEVNARQLPIWVKLLKPFLNLTRILIKFVSGGFFEKLPLKYKVYVSDINERQEFEIKKQRSSYR